MTDPILSPDHPTHPTDTTTMKSIICNLITMTAAGILLSSCASTDAGAGGGASSTAGVKRYPLSTCIVTDNALGSMGPVITRVYGNQEVKFCCKPCIKEFEAEPEKFLAKLPK